MKRTFKYILSLSTIIGMVVSCTLKENFLPSTSDNETLIFANIENFSRHHVGTKSADDEEMEMEINNIAVLMYDSDGKLIADPIFAGKNQLKFVLNKSEKFISTIQTGNEYTSSFENYEGTQIRLYLVANMASILNPTENKPDLSTEDKLLQKSYNLSVGDANVDPRAIDIPTNGFPMIGYADINLAQPTDETVDVSMKKLFAKINVNIRVQVESENNPENMSSVQKPYFRPSSWKVYNVPKSITLRETELSPKPGVSVFETLQIEEFTFGDDSRDDRKVEHSTSSDEYCEISFYIPEYRLQPANHPYDGYPTNITEDKLESIKQYYKPKLAGVVDGQAQKPTYVEISGQFSNYQGHVSDVTYKIYLGQNEKDDFQIKRNQELNNYITIKGLQNHDNGLGEVSIDYRVHVESQGFSIAMERETLLDSHFEFRPMDIIAGEASVVTVTIPNDATWFAAENADIVDDIQNPNLLYDSSRKGLRKYFTTDLISQLSTKTFSFSGPESDGNPNTELNNRYRLWFYFDEYTGTGDAAYDATQPTSDSNKLYREGTVDVTYTKTNDDNTTETQVRKFTFRQMNLWAIGTGDKSRTYSIEYFEEYLYNYASDDNYNVVKTGMPWGLEEQTLSDEHQAIYTSTTGGILEAIGVNMEDWYDTAFANVDINYDFYLDGDATAGIPVDAIKHSFAGLHFTEELVKTGRIDKNSSTLIVDNTRHLSDNPQSAVEYCLNKNKRDANGNVAAINWYLPSIDEAEELLVAGFDFFPVFQSEYYWSSQPAYQKYDFLAQSGKVLWWDLSNAEGFYYSDDINNARATKVTEDENFSEKSGVEGSVANLPISVTIKWSGWTPTGWNATPGDLQYYQQGDPEYIANPAQPGNQPRTKPNRIRCAYKADGINLTNK